MANELELYNYVITRIAAILDHIKETRYQIDVFEVQHHLHSPLSHCQKERKKSVAVQRPRCLCDIMNITKRMSDIGQTAVMPTSVSVRPLCLREQS